MRLRTVTLNGVLLLAGVTAVGGTYTAYRARKGLTLPSFVVEHEAKYQAWLQREGLPWEGKHPPCQKCDEARRLAGMQ